MKIDGNVVDLGRNQVVRPDDGRGRGRIKNDPQKSAICHCDP